MKKPTDDELINQYCKIKGWFKLRYYFGSVLFPYADDFANYCAECWLSGRSIKTNFEYLLTDFWRIHGINMGDKRNKSDMLNRSDLISIHHD